MTDYRALASFSPNGTPYTPGTNVSWSWGHEFYVTSSGMSIRGLWYYCPASTGWKTPNAAVYAIDASGTTGTLVPGTFTAFNITYTAPGWYFQALTNPIPITANQRYKAVINTGVLPTAFTSAFWTTGSGTAGITNGPLVMPSAANATLTNGQSTAWNSGTTTNPQPVMFPYAANGPGFLSPIDVTVTDVAYSTPVEINPHVSSNPAWTNTVSTPINANALENLESFNDSDHPFGGFRTNHMRNSKIEAINVPASTEQTLFDSLGPGVVRYIWFATGGNIGSLDCRLRIYYDGSTTPSVDIDLGTLFAMHYAGSQVTGPLNFGAAGTPQNNVVFNSSIYTTHMHAEMTTNYNAAYTIKYPIPFGNRIRIAYYNPNATTAVGVYNMVYYHYTNTDLANGVRFRNQGLRYADQLGTFLAANPVPLANITTGPGWVVWLSQVGGISGGGTTVTNGSWMERNLCVQIDGESIPNASIVTTGTEDTFDSAWYFEGWHMFNAGPDSYVAADIPGAAGATTEYTVGMATDYLGKFGGIYFNNSCVMSFQPEPACTSPDARVWCVLYYN